MARGRSCGYASLVASGTIPIPLALAIGVGYAGLLLLLLGVRGRRSVGDPRCARCGEACWDRAFESPPRCACGAELVAPRSVRWPRPAPSRRSAILGAALLLLGVGMFETDRWLGRRGLEWGDLEPIAVLAARMERPIAASPLQESVLRRINADWLSVGERSQLLDLIRDGEWNVDVLVGASIAEDPSLRDRWPEVLHDDEFPDALPASVDLGDVEGGRIELALDGSRDFMTWSRITAVEVTEPSGLEPVPLEPQRWTFAQFSIPVPNGARRLVVHYEQAVVPPGFMFGPPEDPAFWSWIYTLRQRSSVIHLGSGESTP